MKKNIVTIFIGIIITVLGGLILDYLRIITIDFPPGPGPRPGPIPLENDYEWQWAGENWYGRIMISNDGRITKARVFQLNKKYRTPSDFSFELGKAPIIESISGTVNKESNDNLNISIVAKKTVKGKHGYVDHIITGTLKPVLCYAGKVKYTDQDTKRNSLGDIVLVNYKSLTGEDVEESFEPSRSYLK